MKVKRVLAALAAWAVILTGTAGLLPEMGTFMPASILTAQAENYDGLTAENYDGLTYEILDDGTVKITGCDKSLTSVVIPEEIDGKAVTSIGYAAFSGCNDLTCVTIPDSVTSIGRNAFDGCTGLTSITIPESVTIIGYWAFGGCTGLTSITISDGVTIIDDFAFVGCTGLTKITIPDSITSIDYCAFLNCSKLANITICNPDCDIFDSEMTICNTYNSRYFYSGTITGCENSTVQSYAEKYGYTFVSLGEVLAPALGDADGSGEVDAVDASNILVAAAKEATGENCGWTDAQKAAADVNGDKVFDSLDASYILQYAAYVGVNGYISMEEFTDK